MPTVVEGTKTTSSGRRALTSVAIRARASASRADAARLAS